MQKGKKEKMRKNESIFFLAHAATHSDGAATMIV